MMADDKGDKGDEVVEIELNGYQAIKGQRQVDRDDAAADAAPRNYRSNNDNNWFYRCFECLKFNNKTQFTPIRGNESEAVHNKMKHQTGSLLRDTDTNENPSYGSR